MAENDNFEHQSKKIKLMERRYKGKKQFIANGAVDRETTFSISYMEWNALNLLPVIRNGEYRLLIYPSQSGKTTRIKELMQMLRQEKYFPIYIDMMAVISKVELELSHFALSSSSQNSNISPLNYLLFATIVAAINNDENQLISKIDTSAYYSLEKVFSREMSDKFFGKDCKVVLLFDEIDGLKELDSLCIETDKSSTRKLFLSTLRSLKPTHFKGSSLHSFIGITNAIFDYSNTLTHSPFNISNIIFGSYFTKEDVNLIWKQYEEQEGVIVDERIKEDIFLKSGGAQGAFMILASYFHNIERDDTKNLPNYSKWKQETSTVAFWDYINSKANFAKMKNQLNRDIIKRNLIQWLLSRDSKISEKDETGTNIETILLQSNILKQDLPSEGGGYIVEFASPLVREFVAICLNPQAFKKVEIETVFTNDGLLDMVKLLELVIRNMNRYMILTGESKSNRTYSGGDEGANEEVYRSAFVIAVSKILPTCTLFSEEKSRDNMSYKEIDNVLEIFGIRVGIEHCANIAIGKTLDASKRDTLMYHVDKAHHYHVNTKAKQTFVIHWTTVENNYQKNKKEKIEYYFPQQTSQQQNTQVETIYVYHNSNCSLFTIVTLKSSTTIPFPNPLDLVTEKSISSAKVLYVRIGKDESSMKDIAIHENRAEVLVSKINEKFKSQIQDKKFSVRVEKGERLFPVTEDAAVAELEKHSILQIDLIE